MFLTQKRFCLMGRSWWNPLVVFQEVIEAWRDALRAELTLVCQERRGERLDHLDKPKPLIVLSPLDVNGCFVFVWGWVTDGHQFLSVLPPKQRNHHFFCLATVKQTEINLDIVIYLQYFSVHLKASFPSEVDIHFNVYLCIQEMLKAEFRTLLKSSRVRGIKTSQPSIHLSWRLTSDSSRVLTLETPSKNS